MTSSGQAIRGQASRILDSNSEVVLVGAHTQFFGTESGVIRATIPDPISWLLANQLPVSTMFRKVDWSRCGGFNEDLAWGEDWHLWVSIVASGGRVDIVPAIGLHYRRRAGQVTSRAPWPVQQRARASVLRAGLPIIDRYPEEACDLLGAQLNQLQAMRQRRLEVLRSKLLARARSLRRSR